MSNEMSIIFKTLNFDGFEPLNYTGINDMIYELDIKYSINMEKHLGLVLRQLQAAFWRRLGPTSIE